MFTLGTVLSGGPGGGGGRLSFEIRSFILAELRTGMLGVLAYLFEGFDGLPFLSLTVIAGGIESGTSPFYN